MSSSAEVCLQAAWMVGLALTLAALAGSTLAGPKIRNMFGESRAPRISLSACSTLNTASARVFMCIPCRANCKEASTLSKDDINRMEAEAVVNVIYGDSTATVAKVIEMVFNVCTATRPLPSETRRSTIMSRAQWRNGN